MLASLAQRSLHGRISGLNLKAMVQVHPPAPEPSKKTMALLIFKRNKGEARIFFLDYIRIAVFFDFANYRFDIAQALRKCEELAWP